MKKIKFIFFIILMLSHYSFANAEAKTEHLKSFAFDAYLSIKDIQSDGLILELNDGSAWDIKHFSGIWRLLGWWSEQKNVSHWTIDDTIEIQYPGSGNFTDFLLVIVNLSRNEKALAMLKQAPSVEYSACLWIADFDKDTNCVALSNDTVWLKTEIDMYGAYFYQKSISEGTWQPGDAVTLIRGEGWLNSDSFFLWNHAINQMPCVNRLE